MGSYAGLRPGCRQSRRGGQLPPLSPGPRIRRGQGDQRNAETFLDIIHPQGIPSLVIAAASMDDVLAISCFTIILGITFTAGDTSLVMLLLHAPLEILVAVVFGLAWGGLVTYLPPQPSPSAGLR